MKDGLIDNFSLRKTKVTILATQALVRSSLELLLNNTRELSVLDVAATTDELLEKVARREPAVVLLCLTADEGNQIEVLTKLQCFAPHARAVVLSAPNSLLDNAAALKLGVTGIVGTQQPAKVLIRAIKQVSEGAVWLNQKLIAQLIDNSFGAKTNSRHQSKRFVRNDELTNRELEVVALIALGLNNKDISKKLFISEATVRHHLSSIYSKLGIEDRLNLAIYAYRRRIVTPRAQACV